MKINFFAPANKSLGYGIHAFNTMLEFEKLGHEICLITPFGNKNCEDENVDRWMDNQATFSVKDPSIMIFQEEFLSRFSGSPRIGFPVFETDKFLPHQLAALKSCDHLLTPSKWSRDVLASHGLASHI